MAIPKGFEVSIFAAEPDIGEPIAFWDFPRAVWKEYNGHVAPWVLPLPVPVGLTIAALAEGVMGLLGKTPNMTQGKVVYSTVNRFYNIEKVSLTAASGRRVRQTDLEMEGCLQARRFLGYEPIVGFEEGVKRAVAVRFSFSLSSFPCSIRLCCH